MFSSLWFSAEDEEDTIAAQEKVEGNVDHAEELDDLAREGSLVILFLFVFFCVHPMYSLISTDLFLLIYVLIRSR